MNKLSKLVDQAKRSVHQYFDGNIESAVILGSGLSNLLDNELTILTRIPYANITGLPISTAPSHKGELVIAQKASRVYALCSGRHHIYEGYSAQQVCTLVYLLRALGANELIITNAAGALHPSYTPGDIMLINDHINFTGHNPLIGQDDSLGTRFPDMSRAYDNLLRGRVRKISTENEITIHEGVYAGVSGPSLETSAERRMLRTLGADAVGMSTVLEVIAANHCGMQVLGMSAITNLALGDENQQPDTIESVLKNAAIAGGKMEQIIRHLLA